MKLIRIAILFIVAFGICTPAANAQFWKRKSERNRRHKHEKAVERSKPHPVTVHEPVAEKKDKIQPGYPQSVKKDVYRVDLLLPLYLNEVVYKGATPNMNSIPEVHRQGLDFYQGALIAADSMAKHGFKLELYVHDIMDANNAVSKLVQDGRLNGTDLIIGMLQSNDIPVVAGYAKQQHINFVSALSPSDAGIQDNPYFIIIQPTLGTHVEKMLEYSTRKSRHGERFLIYRDSSYAEDAYSMIKNEFNKNRLARIKYTATTNFNSYKDQFSTEDTNIVYCTLLNTQDALDIIKKLNAVGTAYKFKVFGMPTWKFLQGLSVADAYPNLAVYYTSPFDFDAAGNSALIRTFIAQNREYGPRMPTEFTYRGYDLMYWMSNLLQQYGPVFDASLKDARNDLFTPYDIMPAWNDDNDYLYLENRQLYMIQFQNGIRKIVN